MKKISFIVLLILIPVILLSVVLYVKQDGTGDYTSISGAFYDVDMQSEGGIIYVFPGSYYAQYYYLPLAIEIDIVIFGINNVSCIIDGNGSSNAIEIINENSNLAIKNFTIEHGCYSGIKIDSGSYGHSTIENCIITDCCDDVYPISQKSGLLCYGNALIQNNTFIDIENVWAYYTWQDYSLGGAIFVDFHTNSINNGHVQIKNNEFINNFAADCGAIYATSNQKISVMNNYFEGNGVIESTYLQNLPKSCVIATFEDCNSVSFSENICYENAYFDIEGPNLEQNSLVFKDCAIAEIFNNTITQNLDNSDNEGINGIIINATNDEGDYEILNNAIYANWSGIVCSNNDYNSLTIDYNNVFNNPPIYYGDNNYWSVTPGTYDISSEPYLASNTFYPIWNSTTKSPCIDTGDPSITDTDGTPSDIGAVSAITHRLDIAELPSPAVDNGWKWLSFPALDIVLNDADIAGNILHDIMYPVLSSDLDKVEAETYTIEYNEQEEEWENDWRQFLRIEGFKFHMNAAANLEVSGFEVPENTSVFLAGEDEENWVGYWLDETQSVSDAFKDYWDGSNIHFIGSQYWAAAYSEEADDWAIKLAAGHELTISYGEMVIIKCYEDISSFRWDNSTPEEEKTILPETEYFTFEEQADYTAIFVELDADDLPQEIGVFVNGECIGATVVEDTLAQINAYTTSAPPGNVELQLYYGSRSAMQNQTIIQFNCSSTDNPYRVQQQINTRENPDAWFISLREDGTLLPSTIQLTLTNFPNPFNPTTTISYSLPHEGKISLDIYNIKGQIVKQLVSGSQPEGYYDVVWNGKDDSGKQVSSGIYYFRVNACGKTLNKKMLMLK